MGKSKALAKEENDALQGLVRSVIDTHFPGRGGQSAFALAGGISQGHVSEMLNRGVGGGVQSLRALAKYRPIEVVRLLGIKLETLVGLWKETDPGGAEMAGLPDNLRRAARAAVELYGCTPDEAHVAAVKVLGQPSDDPSTRDAELWLMDIRSHIPTRAKSGVRRMV